MFPNPLEELNRQASQGCLLVLAFMTLPILLLFALIFFGWLLIKIWPWLILALALYVAYRLVRRYHKSKTQQQK
jgi:uncharacterized membrane protein